MKEIINLNNLDYSELIFFGGVYGNLGALKELKNYCEESSVSNSQIFCNGDICAYCAYPNESLAEIRQWQIHSTLGNVEEQLIAGGDSCGCGFSKNSVCNSISQQWYPKVKSAVSKNEINWLSTLPELIRFESFGKKILICHGSPDITKEFIFESTPWSKKEEFFKAYDVDIIIGGHSGIPFIQKFENYRWVNTGALGMPANDATARTWFVKMTKGHLELVHLNYDYQSASNAMKEQSWPEEYALTLENGLWHSEDILPEQERLSRGQKIEVQKIAI